MEPVLRENLVIIPLKDDGTGNEDNSSSICINANELPPCEDVIAILRREDSYADTWHRVAMLYYRKGFIKAFVRILEEGDSEKSRSHMPGCRMTSIVPLHLSLAAHFTHVGYVTSDSNHSDKAFSLAANWYNRADKAGTKGFEAQYYVGRGFLHLRRGAEVEAEQHFLFVLTQHANFVPALLGKAFVSFSKKDYPMALMLFRQVLQLQPNCSANIRVGIGHCFWKLEQRERARRAFERAAAFRPNDVEALSALAVCYLSTMDKESILRGVNILAHIYTITKLHPVTLNFLADHYFFKKDFDKSILLASHAFKTTKVDYVRKCSAFILGRCYQAMGDYKYGLHYYYEALHGRRSENSDFLPNYGLAQCYIQLDDMERGSKALLKVISKESESNSYLAKKMLGILDSTSMDSERRKMAQVYLKEVLKVEPEELRCRIALATSHEDIDDEQAYTNYMEVIRLFDKRNVGIPPEVYNNVACVLYRLMLYTEALTYYKRALDVVEARKDTDSNCKSHLITILFNMARTNEAKCEFQSAQRIYKTLLKENPSYYCCYIRLGIMARDQGNLHDSVTYFKEALQFDQNHPYVWTFIGNLHLLNQETMLAKKKFDMILKKDEAAREGKDSYTQIAFGNIKLINLQRYLHGEITDPKAITRKDEIIQSLMTSALKIYQQVLEREPTNIYAANGIGCILAVKGLFSEAREVFSQVREADTNFKDVWINMANVYLEEKMYTNAIQMYETYLRKFTQSTDCTLLKCLAKAHYKKKSFGEAKILLLKCRRVAPNDLEIMFQLAKTLRKLGWQTFQTGKSDLEAARDALSNIKLARRIFQSLKHGKACDSFKGAAAKKEVRFCDDLLKQTPHLISRIQEMYYKEQELKIKRELDIQAFKKKQLQDKKRIAQMKKKEDEEMQKRREIIQMKTERVKNTFVVDESERKSKKNKECYFTSTQSVVETKADTNSIPSPNVEERKLQTPKKRRRRKELKVHDPPVLPKRTRNNPPRRRRRVISDKDSDEDSTVNNVDKLVTVTPSDSIKFDSECSENEADTFNREYDLTTRDGKLVFRKRKPGMSTLAVCGSTGGIPSKESDPVNTQYPHVDDLKLNGSSENGFANGDVQLKSTVKITGTTEMCPVLLPFYVIPIQSDIDSDSAPPLLHTVDSDPEYM